MLSGSKETITVSNLGHDTLRFSDGKLTDKYPAIGIQSKMSAGDYDCSTPQFSRTRRLHDLLLEIIDVLISSLLIAPLVVAYWRGTWEFMNIYLFPTDIIKSSLCSLTIGGLGQLFFQLAQHLFTNSFHPDKHRLTYYCVSRIYTYIYGFVCVNMWRGWWILCDYWLLNRPDDTIMLTIAIITVPLIIFIVARTVRTLPAAPFIVAMDHKDNYFQVNTLFRTMASREPCLYTLDVLFSIFVIGSTGVLAWRGVWGLLDYVLYPGNKIMTSYGSLIIGYGIVLLTALFQPLILIVGERLHGLLKFIVCDFFYLIQFIGSVSTWRGIWLLIEVYLKPDDPVLSSLISHIIPFLLLVLLNCSNSVLVKGIEIDGVGSSIEYLQIPIQYVRLHFQHERYKKTKYSDHWEKNALLVHSKNSNKLTTIKETTTTATTTPTLIRPLGSSTTAATHTTTTISTTNNNNNI